MELENIVANTVLLKAREGRTQPGGGRSGRAGVPRVGAGCGWDARGELVGWRRARTPLCKAGCFAKTLPPGLLLSALPWRAPGAGPLGPGPAKCYGGETPGLHGLRMLANPPLDVYFPAQPPALALRAISAAVERSVGKNLQKQFLREERNERTCTENSFYFYFLFFFLPQAARDYCSGSVSSVWG